MIVTQKHAEIYQMEGYFENPQYRFLNEPMAFLLVLK